MKGRIVSWRDHKVEISPDKKEGQDRQYVLSWRVDCSCGLKVRNKLYGSANKIADQHLEDMIAKERESQLDRDDIEIIKASSRGIDV